MYGDCDVIDPAGSKLKIIPPSGLEIPFASGAPSVPTIFWKLIPLTVVALFIKNIVVSLFGVTPSSLKPAAGPTLTERISSPTNAVLAGTTIGSCSSYVPVFTKIVLLPATPAVLSHANLILAYALSGEVPLPGAVSSTPLGATYQMLSSTVPPAYAHSTSVPFERRTCPSVPIGSLTFCVAFLVKISPCAVRTKFESPSEIRSQ